MLLIWHVTSATDAKNYYASSVSPEAERSRQDYYSEGQESPGRYCGSLAERLGLCGRPVDKESFERLCDNLHPFRDEALTPRTNQERRIACDLTVSGPKSFSILEAFAGEEERRRLLRAFDEAVEETVAADLEPDMATRVRVGGADCNRVTGNLLTAAFDHATARPERDGSLPDPHRHKHLLVWNATFDPVEGRIKASQLGDIVRDKGYYRAAIYARLASKLEALGYGIDRRGGNEWEIAGVPQSLIDKFSKRTARIEAEAEARGIGGAARKAELGAKIRSRKKKELSLPELRRAWAAEMTGDERRAMDAVYRKETPPAREVSAAECVAYAIAHCSERESVVPERELKRVALMHGLGSVTPETIAAELPRQGVLTAVIDGRAMATTRELQAEERAIVGFAAKGRGAVRPVGLADGVERGPLNDGQWRAVCGLLDASSRVCLVEGPAGAGKSTMLQKFDEGMRAAGQAVTYLATTTDAASVLGKDGFEVSTVARFLLDEKQQQAAKGGRIVVDEASLLGHKDAYRLFGLADKLDLKLILVGDPMQHGSVSRGATMRILKDYGGVRPFELSEIMRQERPEYRDAARLLSQGDTLAGFDAIDGMGWIKELGGADRYGQIAAEYLQAVKDNKSVLCVSPTHAEAARVTEAIRDALRAAGKLGVEERAFTRLVAANATEAERGQASTYRPGDVLVFHQNAVGFKKGERLTVADPAAVPLGEAAKFQLYRPEPLSLAAGDRIRFTSTTKTIDGKHKLANGTVKTVAGFDRGGNISLDNGWVVDKDAGHFRHGFVETSFGSQGKTVQRAILAMSAASIPASNQEQLYVSASRARERLTLYTDDKAAIRQAVQRSSQKLAALDLHAERKAGLLDRLRKLLERRKRRGVIDRMRAAWERQGRPWAATQAPQPERWAERASYAR